jgi:hypothetical protein
MATLKALKARAAKLKIPNSKIRGADEDELLEMISDAESNGKPKRAVKKSAVKVMKKTAKKSSVKKSASKKSAPAKSRGASKAKRQTTKKAKATSNGYVPKGGRNVLDEIDWSDDEGWNARKGSAPDRILRSLRKFRGNRTKVFDALLPDIGDFVKPKRANGVKFTKAERENMLKYRIARTAWDFAIKTGQHEKAKNRVEYGTGGTGDGSFKKAKKGTAKKAAQKASKPSRKRGRPKGSTTKAKAQKGTQSRTKATTRKSSKAKARRAGRKAASRR